MDKTGVSRAKLPNMARGARDPVLQVNGKNGGALGGVEILQDKTDVMASQLFRLRVQSEQALEFINISRRKARLRHRLFKAHHSGYQDQRGRAPASSGHGRVPGAHLATGRMLQAQRLHNTHRQHDRR